MTANEFNAICQTLTVDPALAMENDEVIEALENGAGEVEIFELVSDLF